MVNLLGDLKVRVAWAIKIIKTDKRLDRGIKDIDLAKTLGTNKNTLADYRKEKGLLKGDFINRLALVYNFNLMWLFKGRGEPFPGARKEYPDVCGPEEAPQETIDKKRPLYNKVEAPGVGDRMVEYGGGVDDFGKAVAGLKEIFDSQDPVLIPAIQANIHAFQISVRRERQVQQQADKISTLEKENTNIKARLEAVEKRLPQTPNDEPTEKKAM